MFWATIYQNTTYTIIKNKAMRQRRQFFIKKKKKDIMKTGLWKETRDFEIIFISVHRKDNSKHKTLGAETTAERVNAKM